MIISIGGFCCPQVYCVGGNMVSEEELAVVIKGWTKANKKTRETLCKNVQKVSFSAGETMLKKTDVAFFCVRKGYVNVFLGSENGDEVFLYRVSKEECCSVSEELTYVFPTTTELLVLAPGAYETAMQLPNVAAFFWQTENKQNARVLAQMYTVLFYGVEKRLADFLLAISARNKGKAIPYTHEQIAKFIGTSREVVTRKLKALEEERIVLLARGRVNILNREELKKRSKE